jgi:hypothetical protein
METSIELRPYDVPRGQRHFRSLDLLTLIAASVAAPISGETRRFQT